MNPDVTTLKRIKVAVLGILGGGLSFLTYYFFVNRFLAEFSSVGFMLAALALTFFLVVFILEVLMIDDFLVLFWFALLHGALAVPLFATHIYPNFSPLVAAGILVLMLFFVFAARQGYRLVSNSLEIRFFSAAHRVLPTVLMGILIFFAVVVYFQFFQLGGFSDDKAGKLFSGLLRSSEPALQSFFPGVAFDMTVSEAVQQISVTQTSSDGVRDPDENALESTSLTTQFVQNTNLKEKTISLLNESFQGSDANKPLNTALFEVLEGKIDTAPQMVKIALQVGAVLLLFLVIKGLMFLIYIPSSLIAFLIFKILLISGFAGISIQNVSKEKIII